jgi:hypothetical protein
VSSRAVVSRRSVLAVLASLCAMLAVGSASALASTPSHTQVIDSPNSLNAVSCVPQTTDCVVSDSKGNALYSTSVSMSSPATWTSWSGPESPSQAVACPSISLCVLADGVAEPGEPSIGGSLYYASSLGGSWTKAFNPAFGVLAVSCASTTLCVTGEEAFGAIRYTSRPASEEWFALDDIGSGAINGVDCLSPSFCAVVDSKGKIQVANTEEKIKEEHGWKSTDVDGTTALHGIACTSSTSCFAVDGEGNVLDLAIDGSGEATVSKHDIDGTNDLTAITCTEGFVCATVDSKGNVFVSSNGGTTWNAQLVLGGNLTSVSCASSSLCVTADTEGSVTAFVPPHFPLSVFVTGEGEVGSTPAGIKCSTEECRYALEGEVTLTETPKAGTGYEFAGWIGCRKASATTCTVDVTAASEVTVVFLKAGKEGAAGKESATGKEGPIGNEGKPGTTGPAGEKGATGTQGEKGPVGPAGAQGPTGPAGKVELVTCTTVKGRQRCTTKLVSGTVRFTTSGASAHATLSRHGLVYAAGTARLAHGRTSLRLLPLRSLQPGKYTLTLISGTGRHKRIITESFMLS